MTGVRVGGDREKKDKRREKDSCMVNRRTLELKRVVVTEKKGGYFVHAKKGSAHKI